MNDFFISYTKTDEPWAEWIAWQLENTGYKTKLMAWDFRPGTNFVREMNEALNACERTLIVLSPAYLNSAFCKSEWAATFVDDPSGEHKKLLPVKVAECELEGLLKAQVFIDLVGLDKSTAEKKLLDGIRTGRAKPSVEPTFPVPLALSATRAVPLFPGPMPPVWTVPFNHNPHFTGRDDLMDLLRETLAGKTAAITQQAIHGLGGVGKTQLAVEYAWKYKADYSTVLWIGADTPENAAANLSTLCNPDYLNLPEAGAEEQEVHVNAVRRWLRSNSRWLLIFDSIDTPETAEYVRGLFEPTWTGHVIITSRLANWDRDPIVRDLLVEVLLEDAAAIFLKNRAGGSKFDPGPDEDARAIARELDGLPLALEQAAAYMLQHRITFSDYLNQLRDARPKLLAEEVNGTTRYQRSVANTWLVTEGQLSLQAKAILRLVAFLAPGDIPRELFKDAGGVLIESLSAISREFTTELPKTPVSTEDALVELADHSLITLKPQRLSCHRLVQAVQSDRMSPEIRYLWTDLALKLVDKYVTGDPHDARTWPKTEIMRTNIEIVIGHSEKLGITNPTAGLMNQLAVFLTNKAALFREADQLHKRALTILEREFGPNHPFVATNLNDLGQLYFTQDKYTEAEPLFKRALVIRESTLGTDHSDVAQSLNDLALLYQTQGQFAEAGSLHKRALAIRVKVRGPDHPDVAQSLNNLATLNVAQGLYAEAEQLIKDSLAIYEKAFGMDHNEVARSLNNLAVLYKTLGRYSEAEQRYKHSLELWEKILGPDHPSVATSLNNLATLYDTQHLYAKSEPLYIRSLAIREKVLGPEHSDVATSLNNLAGMYKELGRYAEAEQLFKRSLALYERTLGPEHSNMATILNNLATLYRRLGRFAEAEQLYKRAHTITLKALGSSHPDVAVRLFNLAVLYHDRSKFAKAEQLYKSAIALWEKALSLEHPDVASARDSLAVLYQTQGKHTKAEQLYKSALSKSEKILGPEHPDVAKSLEHLARFFRATGRKKKALAYEERAAAILAIKK